MVLTGNGINGIFIAKKLLKFLEAVAVKSSNTIIVDNVVFQDYIKKEYTKDSIVIEYGGDHVIHGENREILQKYDLAGKEYFLSVSRAQKDNNIHVISKCF